jgi:hypothetical protein
MRRTGRPTQAEHYRKWLSIRKTLVAALRRHENSGLAPKCPFRSIRTCCGMLAAMRSPNAGHNTRAPQAWLGHRNIQHTVRKPELALDRFKDFWR